MKNFTNDELITILGKSNTEEDDKLQQTADILYYKLRNKYAPNSLTKDHPNIHDLLYRSKIGAKQGEYGYFPASPDYMLTILQRIEAKSIIDLGAGIGILLKIFKDLLNIRVAGYENEPKLIEESKKILHDTCIVERDILKIEKKDIKYFDVLYYWTPFAEHKLQVQFEENLIKIAKNGQYILARSPMRIKYDCVISLNPRYHGAYLYKIVKPRTWKMNQKSQVAA